MNNTVRYEKKVGPGKSWSANLDKGESLELIDLFGKQAIDFLCFSSHLPFDAYNAANTIKLNGSIYLTNGSFLYSDKATKLMHIVDDTCGHHDTLAGCCSEEINFLRYGESGTKNCRDNLKKELSKNGICDLFVPANINFFMNVPVGGDGEVAIHNGLSKPGDKVVLKAIEPVIVLLSNCPQTNNPAAGGNPTEICVRILN